MADMTNRRMVARIGRIFARAPTTLRALLPDRLDAHLYGGAVLVAVGAAMYSRPAGLIVFGAALLVIYWRSE